MIPVDGFQQLRIFSAPVVCHGQIHVQIVAAILGGSPGYLAPEVPDEAETVLHKAQHILRFQVACQQQIETGAAAHGSEVDDPTLPGRLVAQVGGCQMLHGVHLGGVHDRLAVGLGQPQVNGGDGLAADFVFPGYIQPGEQLDMVDGKAGDLFHKASIICFSIPYFSTSRDQMQGKAPSVGFSVFLSIYGLHFPLADDRIIMTIP